MKKWSTSWTGSKKPSKQRKYVANAPLHVRHDLVAAHLSKDLIKRYKCRSIPVRKGDKVIVMRGEFKGKQGTVDRVDLKRLRVYVSGVQKERQDGTKYKVGLHPSNLMIVELSTEQGRIKVKKVSTNG